MSKYINDLIARGENQQLDFKFEISDSMKIARTLVAFSNTDGGKLLVGVKDNGRIAGVRSEEEFHMLEGAARLYCRPEISISLKTWTVDGKTIVEADVPEGSNKPYYCREPDGRWKAWFRQDDQNHPASTVMLEVWKYRHRRRGVVLHFSEKESFLLNYLSEVPDITLEGFCRISGVKKREATAIISKLISFGMLGFRFSEGEFYYFTTDPQQ